MNRTRTSKRRGSTLVPVIVCFVLIGLVIASLLRLGLTARAQSAAAETKLQAEWLAESGLERALAQLADKPDYKGETWEITAADLDASAPGLVKIQVETPDDHPNQRRIAVRAEYPKGSDRRAKQTKSVVVEVKPTAAKEGETP